ncbi:hypothetical protein D3C77_793760 [compost metagenome]
MHAQALVLGLVKDHAQDGVGRHPIVGPATFQAHPLQENLAASQPAVGRQAHTPIVGAQVQVATP